ncbi:MAG: AraC family transcriptional regulator [Candidatus Omnitrophota bacterium]
MKDIPTSISQTSFSPPSLPFFIHKMQQEEMGAHRHNFLELVYIWKGEALHLINNEKVNLHQGDIFFLSMSDCHQYQKPQGLELINILFLPSFLGPKIFNRKELKPLFDFAFLSPIFGKESRYLYLTGTADVKIRALIEEMLVEFEKKARGFEEIFKNDLINLLIILSRIYEDKQSQIAGLKEQMLSRRRKFEEALRYIEGNYTRPISLSEAANISCFTPSYFSEVFHKVTGKPFVRYVNDLKIQHAALLLENTGLKTNEVARQCGFSDYHHFNRTFRKTFHLPPTTEYRKKAH